VIDYVAEKFGDRLKTDLDKIVKRQILMQGRAATPQSATLSMDSYDASTGNLYDDSDDSDYNDDSTRRDEYYAYNPITISSDTAGTF
jgi:hypothetical protein